MPNGDEHQDAERRASNATGDYKVGAIYHIAGRLYFTTHINIAHTQKAIDLCPRLYFFSNRFPEVRLTATPSHAPAYLAVLYCCPGAHWQCAVTLPTLCGARSDSK